MCYAMSDDTAKIFLSTRFHLMLLLCHLLVLAVFGYHLWFRSHGGLKGSLSKFFNGMRTKINVAETLFALFSANLIGISFARSLHYQFYSWYYHQLPFLLFWNSSRTSDRPTLTFIVSTLMKALVLIGVEICWNVYPSTVASSAFLNLYHISILVYLFLDYFESSELTKKAN
ncbi:hypothetical protein Q1695_010712 [Nippostrongylus brasiliensis]|nr:hypothetical protein Q1695_010712 [Nippostrongylus brasiliensis]